MSGGVLGLGALGHRLGWVGAWLAEEAARVSSLHAGARGRGVQTADNVDVHSQKMSETLFFLSGCLSVAMVLQPTLRRLVRGKDDM
jgi:hypothetical protein